MLYLHGGGFVVGSPRSHRRLAALVGAAAGADCLVPDFRLAPEHPHPAAIDRIGTWLRACAGLAAPARRGRRAAR